MKQREAAWKQRLEELEAKPDLTDSGIILMINIEGKRKAQRVPATKNPTNTAQASNKPKPSQAPKQVKPAPVRPAKGIRNALVRPNTAAKSRVPAPVTRKAKAAPEVQHVKPNAAPAVQRAKLNAAQSKPNLNQRSRLGIPQHDQQPTIAQRAQENRSARKLTRKR